MEFPTRGTVLVTPFGEQRFKRFNNDTPSNTSRMYKRRATVIAPRYGLLTAFNKRKYKKYQYKPGLKRKRAFKTMLKRYQKPEAKVAYHSFQEYLYPSNNATPGDALLSIPLSTPIVGGSQNQRIGNNIQVYGVTLKASIQNQHLPEVYTIGSEKYYAYTTVRVSLIYDKTPGGNAIPAVGDVFTDNATGSTQQLPPHGIIEPQWRKRFKVIRDWYFELDGIKGEGYVLDKFIPLKVSQEYGASTGAIQYTDLRSGGLFLTVQTTCPALNPAKANTIPWLWTGSVYLHYIDT